MKRRMLLLFLLLMVLVSLLIMAGCFASSAVIRRVDQPKEEDLRANWQNYNAYCLESYAILFQFRGDKTIQKGDDWREITSDQTASRCASFLKRPSPVMILLGENDEKFGYLIYELYDGVSAAIIDPKTIRLFYHATPRVGP